MRPGDAQSRAGMLEEIGGELERGGAGRPEEIARRLGPAWTEELVRAALAELFSGSVVGQATMSGSGGSHDRLRSA